ncbi:hypothetical protein ZEAMMB73_Zm00001d044572 [Zea mays]|uniref:Uncharacterized protein n=1 Tax=Zea mays TaxID=4577 RepID=A0A1D6NNN5_MAIZE|nr:hypothetical protein ZEAMMB73_Zm00001d044572 [Zea mays]
MLFSGVGKLAYSLENRSTMMMDCACLEAHPVSGTLILTFLKQVPSWLVRGKCIVPLCGTRFYLRISLCIMFLRNRKSLTSEICTHLRIREFLVTVTVKKIGDRWWYNACKKCTRTTVAHGDSYKCSDQVCATIGTPNQRLLVLIAALWF